MFLSLELSTRRLCKCAATTALVLFVLSKSKLSGAEKGKTSETGLFSVDHLRFNTSSKFKIAQSSFESFFGTKL